MHDRQDSVITCKRGGGEKERRREGGKDEGMITGTAEDVHVCCVMLLPLFACDLFAFFWLVVVLTFRIDTYMYSHLNTQVENQFHFQEVTQDKTILWV